MQAFVFLVFFASQICLLELFVQKMFFDDLDVVKTSMNFEQMSDIQYPQITICRSFPYDKQELKSNQNSILGVFISWLKNYIHRDVAYFTSQKSSVISYLNNSILKFENNTNILQWASIFHTYYNEPWKLQYCFNLYWFTEYGISSNLASYISLSHNPYRYSSSMLTSEMMSQLEQEFQQLVKNFDSFENLLRAIVLK